MKIKPQNGLTLIELLVVISIIGLLSSIIMTSLNTSRQKARDSKRIMELREISKAVELYYLDTGHYPRMREDCHGDSDWAVHLSAPNDRDANWTCLNNLLSKYFPNGLPTDPMENLESTGENPWNGRHRYGYSSNLDGNVYQLIALLEAPESGLSCAKRFYRFLPWQPRPGTDDKYSICDAAKVPTGSNLSLEKDYPDSNPGNAWTSAPQLYAYPN